jgi:RNA polymerase sigma-70 factor, ECF subfamily
MADTSSMPDHELLAAVAAGDQSAFERLYERFEKRAFQYALSIVRDRFVAEEVLVDAMTSVWHGASGFTGQSQVSTWILGIARHKALDALRRSARNRRNEPLEDSPELADETQTTAEALDRASGAQATRRALARLSQDHQEILRLAFFEELPYEDIAALLAIPVNTVKTRVYYAKQQLKRCLGELAQPEHA